MNLSDIMAEAVLSTEKSCLVSHATHFVAVSGNNTTLKIDFTDLNEKMKCRAQSF